MLVRRLGAGFSGFSVVITLIACDTKLTSPGVQHVKNVPWLFKMNLYEIVWRYAICHLETSFANFAVKV